MKKQKKIFVCTLAVLLVVSAIFVFSSCGNKCNHVWQEASCTAPKTCTLCGATEGEALDHTWSKPPCTGDAICTVCNAVPTDTTHPWDEGKMTKPFDCLTTGEMTYTCTACGETTVKTVTAKGHVYTDTVVAPTCLRIGYTLHTCNCGYSYADAEVDALDHDWKEEPTCAHDRACNRCDVTEEALPHSYSLIDSCDADCDSLATETYFCAVCEDEYVDEVAPADGHDTTGATQTERFVSGCKYVLVSTCNTCTGEVLGKYVYHHTYVASVVRDATCKEKGEKLLTCSTCGDKVTEKIPESETGHKWTEGSAAGGKRTDTCNYCGETKEVIVVNDTKTPSMSAESLTDTEIKLQNANITLDSGVVDTIGKTANVVISSDKIEGDDRDALGLSPEEMAQLGGNPVYNFTIFDGTQNVSNFGEDNYVTVTLPYVLADGEDVDSIAIWYINDKGELASIPATYNNGFVTFKTNHFSYYTVTRLTPAERCALYGCSIATSTVDPTCEEAGYTLSVCVRCHKSERIPGARATGHKYIKTEVGAGCKTDGKITHTCEYCGHSYSKTIKSKGHDWKLEESVGVGCGNPGYKIYSCRTCGEEYTEWKPQKKHEYEEKVTEATCVAFGTTEYKCKNCDHSYTIQTPATGVHKYEKDVCVWCGAKKPSGCSHLSQTAMLYDFGEHGGCDWSIYYYACDCGLVKTVDADAFGSQMGECRFVTVSREETDTLYTEQSRCSLCGMESSTRAEKRRDGCEVIAEGEITFSKDDEELITFRASISGIEHEWEEREIDLSKHGACDDVMYVEECKHCGMMVDVDVGADCYFGNEEEEEILDDDGNVIGWKFSATCSTCGLYGESEELEFQDDCLWVEKYSISFYMGKKCICEGEYLDEEEDHDYEYTVHLAGDDCFDAWKADLRCVDCGKRETRYGTGHLSDYESVSLSSLGLCDGNAGMTACAACGEIESAWVDDWSCWWSRQEELIDGTIVSVCNKCGVTRHESAWIYEEDGCKTTETRTVTYYKDDVLLGSFVKKNSDANHSYEYTFVLKGSSCEDGVSVTAICKDCGEAYSYETTYHETFKVKSYDVADYGACGGEIYLYACACGQQTSSLNTDFWSEDGYCHTSYTTNTYRDEAGRLIYVETHTCSACGLRYTNTYYEVSHPEECTVKRYHTVVINVGATLVEQFDYVRSEEMHDYSITGQLHEGAVDCEDGVELTYTCKTCGYGYTSHTSWHEEIIPVRTIDLSDYGSVCGGTMTERRCVCGLSHSLEFNDDMLCELDGYWVPDPEIEGELDCGSVPSTDDSYYTYYTDAYLYTCAVTDPVRCPFKIRRIDYWKADGCRAYEYERWQIGYNSETDTALYEITFQTGEVSQYHRYTETEIDEGGVRGRSGVCSVCGATYSDKDYYDASGNLIKEEFVATNPSHNGENRRFERIYEYVEVGGYWEESSRYTKTVYADGEEYWYRNDYSYDLVNCVQTRVYTDSDGYSDTSSYSHWRDTYYSIRNSTCTQDGEYGWKCAHCDYIDEQYTDSAHGHWWYSYDGGYYCSRCGIESENGADGDIILEDLTEEYGSDTEYVAGYYNKGGVAFTYYVSLILHTPKEDGNDEVVLSGISFTERTDARAISFSKQAVRTAATRLGYAEGTYDVRFAFVPVGSDGSFDYAITFN